MASQRLAINFELAGSIKQFITVTAFMDNTLKCCMFPFCLFFASLLKNAQELKDYLEDMFVVSAQYDNHPKYPVSQICHAIDGAPQESNVLDKIFAAVVATKGNRSCYSTNQSAFSSETLEGWRWQVNLKWKFNLLQ